MSKPNSPEASQERWRSWPKICEEYCPIPEKPSYQNVVIPMPKIPESPAVKSPQPDPTSGKDAQFANFDDHNEDTTGETFDRGTSADEEEDNVDGNPNTNEVYAPELPAEIPVYQHQMS
ncbi:hypothetical protein ACH5RR_012777 [Cinchona calisaya]|uniref:Uncharacterized protein n=1 Tax=Cinchona calisaya TaxID=153742 RepID=A0ABD3A8J4_9GENT